MNKNFPRKSLFGTEDRTLFCSHVGREYHLSVWLPESYDLSNKAYPVMYLLDGDLNFGMAAGLTMFLPLSQEVAEVIVVGINYEMESFDQWLKLRELDFKIPEVQYAPLDSHANLFLKALTQEMIPFVEANYRTVPTERCLFGYSSSGFFALYTLCNQPDAFRHYLCGSGDYYISYPYLIEHDQKLRERNSNDPIQLYCSVGELEDFNVPSFQNLISFLENGKYPGLTLESEIYEGEGHSPEGLALTCLHGLRRAYKVAPTT